MLQELVWTLCSLLIGAWAAWFALGKVARATSISETNAIRSRMRYQLEKLNAFKVVENMTLGWFNVLFKYAWPGFLCDLASNLASNLFRRLLTNVMSNMRANPVVKYLRVLELAEFSFGAIPPTFSNGTARLTPNELTLELELDVAYRSCGARLVINSLFCIGGREWPVRFNLDEFTLRGRLLLVFQLGWRAPPGIAGIEVTFVERPEIDFRISPVVTELPGVSGQLKAALLRVMQNEIVEPARVFVNLQQAFANQVSRKKAGARGQLRVTISHATDLKPAVKAPEPPPRNKELCVAFAEVRLFGKVHSTPVAPQGNSPAWNWTLYVPVNSAPTADVDCVLDLAVCNMSADDQPMTIGAAKFALASLAPEDVTGAEPYSVSVRLKVPKGFRGGGGRLHLKIAWDQELRARFGGDSARRDGVPSRPRLVQSGSLSPSAGAQADARPPVDPATPTILEDVGREQGGGDEESSSEDGEGDAGWAMLAQAARAEKLIDYEDTAALHQKIEDLEARLHFFRKTQAVQARRALVQGAKFVMHRGWDEQLKLVWYDSSFPPTIKWEASTSIPKMGKKVSALKTNFYSQPAANMESIAVGDGLFPFPTSNRSAIGTIMKVFGRGDTTAKMRGSRCFSVIFDNNSALHLEVPETGNGRSRNEWVEAFKGVLNERFDESRVGEVKDG